MEFSLLTKFSSASWLAERPDNEFCLKLPPNQSTLLLPSTILIVIISQNQDRL